MRAYRRENPPMNIPAGIDLVPVVKTDSYDIRSAPELSALVFCASAE